jgi:hypothetical protein
VKCPWYHAVIRAGGVDRLDAQNTGDSVSIRAYLKSAKEELTTKSPGRHKGHNARFSCIFSGALRAFLVSWWLKMTFEMSSGMLCRNCLPLLRCGADDRVPACRLLLETRHDLPTKTLSARDSKAKCYLVSKGCLVYLRKSAAASSSFSGKVPADFAD